MDHQLSVLVQADLHGACMRPVVSGGVTEAHQHVLHPLVRRSRAPIPPVAVTVDRTPAEQAEEGAVDRLRRALEQDITASAVGPAEPLLLGQMPAHRLAPAGISRGESVGRRAA